MSSNNNNNNSGVGRGFKSHPVHFLLWGNYGIKFSSFLGRCRTNSAAMLLLNCIDRKFLMMKT
jgi:hypothetical protein